MTGTPWPSGESEEDIMWRLSPPVPTKSRTTRRCRHIITPDTYMRICGAPHIHMPAISTCSAGAACLMKILWHDGLGMSLYAKRLERGRFIWPSPADGVVAITAAQLGYMLEGIDWRNPHGRGGRRWPADGINARTGYDLCVHGNGRV